MTRPELTKPEMVSRILEIIKRKHKAIDNMGDPSTAQGLQIAFNEVGNLSITEFGMSLEELKPKK